MGLIAEGIYLGSRVNSGDTAGTYICSHKMFFIDVVASFASTSRVLTLTDATLTNYLILPDNSSSFYFKYLFILDPGAGKAFIAEVECLLSDDTLLLKEPIPWNSQTPEVRGIMQSFSTEYLQSLPAAISKPIKKAIVKALDPAPGTDLTIVTNGNIQQSIGLVYDFPYIVENPGGIVPFAISDAGNFALITQY